MNIETSAIPQISLETGCIVSQSERLLRSGTKIVATAGTDAIVAPQGSRRRLNLEAHSDGERLFPRIPDEETLKFIIPRLSWRDFPVLSAVNKTWFHAVRGRKVYDARVLCHSTETLVLMSYEKLWVTSERRFAIAFYSAKDNACFELPPIPCFRDGLPFLSEFVALDRKIYVLGGLTYEDGHKSSDKVYVFDLAGEKKWTECASMKDPRAKFGCRVLGGKIYVFGGWCSHHLTLASEAYDPTQNAWSQIMPMPSECQSSHRAYTIGRELVVLNRHEDVSNICEEVKSLQVYNPGRNEWREVEYSCRPGEMIFAAQGKLYSMGEVDIHFRDIDENSWNRVHSFSSQFFLPPGLPIPYPSWPAASLVVDGEILALVKYRRTVIILQSKGFGKHKEEITWQVKGELLFSAISTGSYIMQPIEL